MKSAWFIIFGLVPFLICIAKLVSCLDLNTYEQEREKYGSVMASYIKTSVDPCDDFYEYACGNYFKINKDEPSLGRSGAIFLLKYEMENKIHEMLMEPVISNKNRTAADVAKIFYQSCMQENVFNYKKSEAYLKLIDSLGGWPVLNKDWKNDKFNWFDVVSASKSYDINTIFDEIPDTIGGLSVLSVDDFGLFSMKGFLKRPYSRAYHKNKEVAKQIMIMYGVSKKEAIKVFKEIVDVFVKIRNYLKLKNLRKGRSIINLKKMENIFTTMKWREFYSNLYDETELDTMNIKIYNIDKIRAVAEFLSENNSKEIANYIFLKLLFGLHDELRHSKNKKQFCIGKAMQMMNPVISAMFLKSKYHEKHFADDVLTLISYIKSAFINSINSSDWLDKYSKINVIKKINAMKVLIGDNMQMLNMEIFDRQYRELNISLDNGYYQNHLILRKYATKHNVYRKSFKISRWIDVSAFYVKHENQLIIPAGIYRRPFYYPELPKSYNFGIIGAILGHEMTHSLDIDSISLDERGEWSDILSEENAEQYFLRSSCLIDQYDNYTIVELNKKVEGFNTLSDNIADNGGIRHAFYGYKNWLKANQGQIDISKQTLPMLNITDTQLLFLSYAQSWCKKIRGLQMYKEQIEDDHAPARWRVIGSLSNFEEFSTAFGCKEGSPMNRVKKCIICGGKCNCDGLDENWWSSTSSAEFNKRAQCFVDQYNNYTIDAIFINVNGTSTLAENIADNGGVRLGFYAYKKWAEKHQDEGFLADLYKLMNVSQDQLYFWSFAHASCSEFNRRGLQRIAKDVHTADKFRVNGPLSNFEEFGKAFNCQLGTPMNPIKKCVLW